MTNKPLYQLIAAALTLTLVPGLSLADLPTASQVVPSGVSTTNPVSAGMQIFLIFVQFGSVLLGAVGVIAIGAWILQEFGESRQKGEWGKFITFAIIGVLLIGLIVILATLAFDWASNFTATATVS